MTSIDPEEVERFSRIAAEWWDPQGKFAPLHVFNPVRLGFIRDQAEMRFGGPNDPALVLDPGDADVQYILMPLRV